MLRRAAEARLKEMAAARLPMTKAVQQGNQQELEIHQIELEMQNEDLRQMHVQLDTALARYTDLYDFAPVGYMTIRPDGVIQQTNLAAASLLGIERLHLLGWRFGMFVAVEARADFNALVARAIETKASEVGEVGLSVKGKPPLTVQLRISVSAGGQECRLVLIDITERRQAEEQLGEHRAFLDNVLEGTHPGTWGWNVQTGQAQVNARWAEMLGYTLAELAPITIQTWLALVHPADLKNSDAARDAHFNRTADIYECEFRMKHKDGSWVWMEDRGRVVEWTSDNKPLLMAGTHLDITVRKRAEYQLDERRKELEAFFGLAALGAKTGITLDEIYQDFVNLLPASWQYPKVTCARIIMGDSDFRTHNFKPSAWMQSVPVRVKGAVVGRLEVGYLEERPEEVEGPFVKEEKDLIEALARQIGNLTERKEAEVALRASEEKHRLLFENAGDMIFIHDEEGQTLDANPMAVKLFGYTRLELMSMTLHQIESPEAPLPTADRIARLLKEGHLTFETVLQCKDGSLVPTEVNTRRIVWDGEPTFLGICRDITKRKEAEEKLRQLSARLLRHRDEEQRHIARELHDVIGQNLAAMTINLDFLLTSADRLPPEARQALLDSEALAKQTAKEVRTFSFLLHPPLLEELGLGGALQDYVPGFARRSGIRVDLELPPDFERMPQETELTLFRVIQESLANIHRHSGSKTACITLNQTADKVQLEVRDAGRGFALTPSESAGPASALGVGIPGMQERLRQLGGRLHISSSSDGTIVRATLPCVRKRKGNPQ